MRRMNVRNLTKGSDLADRAGVADNQELRNRGLLKHTSLEKGDGLWIVPSQSVHMFGMKFAIDLVYLNRKKQVVKVRRDFRPWRISLCLKAHSVLELPVGTIDESRTEVGDQMEFINHS
jgi:uncharacterized membrane protein (UPF0127 family)